MSVYICIYIFEFEMQLTLSLWAHCICNQASLRKRRALLSLVGVYTTVNFNGNSTVGMSSGFILSLHWQNLSAHKKNLLNISVTHFFLFSSAPATPPCLFNQSLTGRLQEQISSLWQGLCRSVFQCRGCSTPRPHRAVGRTGWTPATACPHCCVISEAWSGFQKCT